MYVGGTQAIFAQNKIFCKIFFDNPKILVFENNMQKTELKLINFNSVLRGKKSDGSE